MTDILSLAAFAADQLTGPVSSFTAEFAVAADWFIIEIKETTVSHTSTIIAEMRKANSDAIASHNDKMATKDWWAKQGTILPSPLPKVRPALATAKGRSEAQMTAQLLLVGTKDVDRNMLKREASLPRRAMSMAASRGRVTPDGFESVMRYFANPGSMAQGLLASFLPEKVSTEQAKALLSDPFVVDVIEGFGVKVPAAKEAVALVKNPSSGRGGGAPGRVIIADGTTPATVPTGKRGRPSGPKFVDYLRPTSDVCEVAAALLTGVKPVYGPECLLGIPGGNDVAQGSGAQRRLNER